MKRVLVLFIVGVVLFGSCSAQKTNAQSNSSSSVPLKGIWFSPGGNLLLFSFENEGEFELQYMTKGTYTNDKDTITLTITHRQNPFSRNLNDWMELPEPETETVGYTITGNKLTIDGLDVEFTKRQ